MTIRVTNDFDGIASVVCAMASTPSLFTDNVLGQCATCGCAVQHRPHIPQPSMLICLACYTKTASPDDDVVVTPRTVVEVQRVLGRGKDTGD